MYRERRPQNGRHLRRPLKRIHLTNGNDLTDAVYAHVDVDVATVTGLILLPVSAGAGSRS
jgi:hypothetical protein